MSSSTSQHLDHLDANALRALLLEREQQLESKARDIREKELAIAKLTHEIAVLRRIRFGKKSEQLSAVQASLFEDAVAADIAAIEEELKQLTQQPREVIERQQPKRRALPPELPRIHIYHEPSETSCDCGCQRERIGEDVSEKLDYEPGVARVERHIRGKWVCRQCETLVQEPVPAHVLDKGLASTGLLAHVLVAKYADHLPLYRQQQTFGRAGVKIPTSTLADWVGVCGVRLQPLVDALREVLLSHSVMHADETPIQVLSPEVKKSTQRAYLWAYAPGEFESLRAVVYDFAPSRAGEHARAFLEGWQGDLVTDDYVGYKQSFREDGVTEAGCWAHARRKFFDLHAANQSQVAQQALDYIGKLYTIEREAKLLQNTERWRLRQEQSKPIADRLHAWMMAQRSRVLDGTGIAKALDYSLKRWVALTRYLDNGAVPIDNNMVERLIRPIAIGRNYV